MVNTSMYLPCIFVSIYDYTSNVSPLPLFSAKHLTLFNIRVTTSHAAYRGTLHVLYRTYSCTARRYTIREGQLHGHLSSPLHHTLHLAARCNVAI